MLKTFAVSAVVAICATCANAQMKGAGSSFAAPLYGGWSQSMAKSIESRLDYTPIGSSGGVKAVQDRSVDFGASDRPLSRAELEQAGLAQFPSAIGGVVLMVNIPGVPSETFKLDAPTLAAIFVGSVKKWNDPAVRALNPDISLPALPIVPIYRSDGSGTSYVLSTYLSKVSPQFKSTFGVTSNLTLFSDKSGKSSAEIGKLVRDTPGAIGYFDYAHAADLALPTIQMRNHWGKFVAANRESIQVAMRSADWEKMLIDQDPTFDLDLTDAGCPGCWPIATATYVLVPIKGRNANSHRVLEFFEQALQNGDEFAIKEGYVPLPSRAKNIVWLSMRRWQTALEKAGAGKPQRRMQGPSSDTHVAVL